MQKYKDCTCQVKGHKDAFTFRGCVARPENLTLAVDASNVPGVETHSIPMFRGLQTRHPSRARGNSFKGELAPRAYLVAVRSVSGARHVTTWSKEGHERLRHCVDAHLSGCADSPSRVVRFPYVMARIPVSHW